MNPITHLQVRMGLVWSDGSTKSKCFALWDAHLKWLYDLGFPRAKEIWATQIELPQLSGHEVVDLLNEYVQTRGYVNAHLGLTSSDIVDNVRLMQTKDSLDNLFGAVSELILKLDQSFGMNLDTVGFTHWQPAAPLNWFHRTQAWIAPLHLLLARIPTIRAKRFGGPVGDAASLRLIVGADRLVVDHFDWEPFDLAQPDNPFPLQSSDHSCETQAVDWVCAVAAQLHKIAMDLRFLASHGLVYTKRPAGHAGSSSMPHKVNPYKWEKVCSICRSVSTTQAEMWSVAAHNGCERTLDTSWQLKSLLRRGFMGLALAIDEMLAVECGINQAENNRLLGQLRDKISSDHDLTRRVLAGESRWSAYQQMLAESNHA